MLGITNGHGYRQFSIHLYGSYDACNKAFNCWGICPVIKICTFTIVASCRISDYFLL